MRAYRNIAMRKYRKGPFAILIATFTIRLANPACRLIIYMNSGALAIPWLEGRRGAAPPAGIFDGPFTSKRARPTAESCLRSAAWSNSCVICSSKTAASGFATLALRSTERRNALASRRRGTFGVASAF